MANIDFNNINSLIKHIDTRIQIALEQCAIAAESMLTKLLKERLYDAYTPEMYDRTYELLNSISHSHIMKAIDGGYYAKIYYDTDKIKPYTNEKDGLTHVWGKHTDFENRDISKWLPLWVEYGTNNKYYSHNGTNSIEDTRAWLETEYNKLFSIALKLKLDR